jgi:hypothetical protein
MKPVYVNGIENVAIVISEIDRLIKNFQSSDDMRSPFNNTIIVIILNPKEIKAVVE